MLPRLPRLPNLTVPAIDLNDDEDKRLNLDLLSEYLVDQEDYVPVAQLTPSSLQQMPAPQIVDRLKLEADAVMVAPAKQKASAKRWLLEQVKTVFRGWQTATEYVAANVALGTAAFIPGEQQIEANYRGLKEDPDSVYYKKRFGFGRGAAAIEAYQQTKMPWGAKFGIEAAADPLNIVPGSWLFKHIMRPKGKVGTALTAALGGQEAKFSPLPGLSGRQEYSWLGGVHKVAQPVAGGSDEVVRKRQRRVFTQELADFPVEGAVHKSETLKRVVASIDDPASRSVFEFMRLTGMRPIDIQRLDLGGLAQVGRPEPRVLLREVEKDLASNRSISQEAKDFLLDYVENVRPSLLPKLPPDKHPTTVFLTRTGHPFTANYLTSKTRGGGSAMLAAAAAKVDPSLLVIPSDFRHTFATNLVDLDYPLSTIRQFTGHQDLLSLQTYTHSLKVLGNRLPTPFSAEDLASVPPPLQAEYRKALGAGVPAGYSIRRQTKSYTVGKQSEAVAALNLSEGDVLLALHGKVELEDMLPVVHFPPNQQRAYAFFVEALHGAQAADTFASQGFLARNMRASLGNRLKGNRAAEALHTLESLSRQAEISERYAKNLHNAASIRLASGVEALGLAGRLIGEPGPLGDLATKVTTLLTSMESVQTSRVTEARLKGSLSTVNKKLKALEQEVEYQLAHAPQEGGELAPDQVALRGLRGPIVVSPGRVLRGPGGSKDTWTISGSDGAEVGSRTFTIRKVQNHKLTKVTKNVPEAELQQYHWTEETLDLPVDDLFSGKWSPKSVASSLALNMVSPNDVVMTTAGLRAALNTTTKNLLGPLKESGAIVAKPGGGYRFSDEVVEAFDAVDDIVPPSQAGGPPRPPSEMGELPGPDDIGPPDINKMDNGGSRVPNPIQIVQWATDSIKDNFVAARFASFLDPDDTNRVKRVLGQNVTAGTTALLRPGERMIKMAMGRNVAADLPTKWTFARQQARKQALGIATNIRYHLKAAMEKEFGYQIGIDGAGGQATRVALTGQHHPAALGLEGAAAERETRRITTILATLRKDLPTYYNLTDGQLRYYDYYHEYTSRLRRMLEDEGFDTAKIIDKNKNMESWQRYVPRTVLKTGPRVQLPPRPMLGDLPGHLKPPKYKTMREGEAAGEVYHQDPVRGLEDSAVELYGHAIDHQTIKALRSLASPLPYWDKVVASGDEALKAIDAKTAIPNQWYVSLSRYYPSVYDAIKSGGVTPEVRESLSQQLASHRASLKAEAAITTAEFTEITGVGDLTVHADLIPSLQLLLTDSAARTGLLAGASSVSSMFRLMATGMDIGAPAIHGAVMAGLMLSPSPTVSLKVRAVWPKAVGEMFMSLVDPTRRATYFRTRVVQAQEARDVAGVEFFSDEIGEMVSSARAIKDVGTRIGGVAGAPVKALGAVAMWTAEAFNAFLDIARLEMYIAMRAGLPEAATAKQLAELGSTVNAITGTVNKATAGISVRQQQVESAAIFYAPSLRRAAAALVGQAMFGSGMQRRRAFEAVGSLVSSALAIAAIVKLSGNNDDVFDPTTPDFMSLHVGDGRIGLGTPYYTMARIGGSLYRQLKDDPAGLGRFTLDDHALLKWARSQLAPVTALAVDVVAGRTFIGDPLRGQDGDWLKFNIAQQAIRQGIPFWMETITMQPGVRPLGIAELVGLRTSPISVQQRLDNLRVLYLQSDTSDPLLVAWREKQEAEGTPLRVRDAPLVSVRRLAEKYPGTNNYRHPDIVALEEEGREVRLTRSRRLVVERQEFVDAVSQNRRIIDSKLTGVSREFNTGIMSGKDYRNKVDGLAAELRGMNEATARTYKGVVEDMNERRRERLSKPEKDFEGDIAYDLYRATVTASPALHDEDGNFRSAEFKRLQASFRASVGADMWAYVEKRAAQGRDLPAAAQDLNAARKGLQPYWNLHETLWGSGLSELVASYVDAPTREVKASLMLQYPILRSLLKRLDAARRAYRLAHPEVDGWLTRFYDYSPLTAEGLEVKQLRVTGGLTFGG